MKRKIGLSVFGLQRKYGDKEAIRLASQCGADCIDLNLCGNAFDCNNPESVYSKSDEEIMAYFTELKEYAESLGVEINQTHGRGEGYKNIKEEDEALLKNARLDCLATKAVGASVCVMHGVTSIFMGPDADPKLMRDLNFKMFCEILEYAKRYGVVIATETFGDAVRYASCDFFGNADEFIKTYNRICAVGDNAKYFKICADVGHSNKAMKYNNPTPADVVRMLGKNIAVLHLHDNDTNTDQHKMPFSGTIDWNDVFDALDEVGYDGVYNMEMVLGFYGEEMMCEYAAFAIKDLKNALEKRYGKQ